MPDVTKIKLPDGTVCDIKDTTSGYTSNLGTITGVSLNGTSVATSGVADLQIASAAISANVSTHTLNITTTISNGDGVGY